MQDRVSEISQEMRVRAIAEEDNTVHPGQPTLVGLIRVLLADVAKLRARVEALEGKPDS